VLFNEPKLLKSRRGSLVAFDAERPFSALQRAEIAEIELLQRAAELMLTFSALQRAEIAEITAHVAKHRAAVVAFSALQRAEIAEIRRSLCPAVAKRDFQCSSTSRNC